MKSKVTKPEAMTRSDERKLMREFVETVKKNPEIGRRIAQEAGIVDKNGRLTSYYKKSV